MVIPMLHFLVSQERDINHVHTVMCAESLELQSGDHKIILKPVARYFPPFLHLVCYRPSISV